VTERDDAELARCCQAGDTDAMRLLIERYQTDVFAVCMRLLRHAHDAEDVAQEVFVRVFRSLASWDVNRPMRPWILSIAVNRCRTALSRRKKRPENVDYLAETLQGRAVPETDELHSEILRAVDALRDDYREVFVLFHEQGQPYEEIASVTGRPVGTIKTWLHRARAEVLARLQARGLMPASAQPQHPVQP
jgi:RNA polymerase sigma factor (sigma-70 family)